MGVQGAELANKGHHPCGGPRDCTSSQGLTPQWGSKGLNWQTRAATPVGVQGTELANKGQHSFGPRDCTSSQGLTLPWGSKGLNGRLRDGIVAHTTTCFHEHGKLFKDHFCWIFSYGGLKKKVFTVFDIDFEIFRLFYAVAIAFLITVFPATPNGCLMTCVQQ